MSSGDRCVEDIVKELISRFSAEEEAESVVYSCGRRAEFAQRRRNAYARASVVRVNGIVRL